MHSAPQGEKQVARIRSRIERNPGFLHGNIAPDFAALAPLNQGDNDLIPSRRRAATYVDKILKGAKPVDLPVEQPIGRDHKLTSRDCRKIAYRNSGRIGIPKGGNKDCTMVAAAPVLPVGCAKRIADRRMILSGYRLADLLTRILKL